MDWAPGLGLSPTFAVDGLATALLPLVTVVAGAVAWWSASNHETARPRVLSLLGLFVVAMTGLLTAGDVLTYVVAWELTSVLSYLLVGLDHGRDGARTAARSTLLVTGAGGVTLLTGLLLVAAAAGGTSFEALLAVSTDDPRAIVGFMLVLVGAATKSAQLPFHGWLLGAGTAPTSASALLHAATLVVAGVHVVLRVAPAAAAVPGWSAAAATIGLATFVWSGWAALRADETKQVLAGTTSAQLGLAFALAGLGTSTAATAAVALLLVHGLYKAGLFLLAGSAKVVTGSTHVDALSRLARTSPVARATLWVGAAALAGAPPLAGWVTKETAVATLLDAFGEAAIAPLVTGAALGVLVAARLVGVGARDDAPVAAQRRPGPGTLAAPGVLVAATVAIGAAPTVLTRLVTPVAGTDAAVAKLVLWPGLVPALAVSLAGLAAGAAAVTLLRADLPPRRTSAPVVLAALTERGLAAAGRVTRAVHVLPRTAVVGWTAAAMLLTLLPLAAAASRIPSGLRLADSVTQAVIGSVLLVAVVGAVVVRNRLAGALLLGVVGYALAGLFAVHGAPDLVLTQVVVETVIVVVFVAVLRTLPGEPPRTRRVSERDWVLGRLPATDPPPPRRHLGLPTWARALVAVSAAALTADLALTLAAQPAPRPLAALLDARAVPDGAGANVVNVVLTDFRALDTLGELVVLTLAALAVLALARRASGSGSGSISTVAPADGVVAATTEPPPSRMLAAAAPTLTRLAVVVGVHLLVVGHDQPGGGFIGGLVVGAGLALHRLAAGTLPDSRVLADPTRLLAIGVGIVAAVAIAPVVAGGALGDMGAAVLDLGPVGTPKLTSALVLDIGVLAIVVGVVLTAIHLLVPDHPTTPTTALEPA